MPRKALESMTAEELKQMILWYEGRTKYARFLLAEKGGN